MQVKKKSFLKKILLAALVTAGLGAAGYWYYSTHAEGIYTYNASTDRAFIMDLFKKNWYWLISDYSSKDYSVEQLLDEKITPEHTGLMIIKTYRIKDKPIGFVTYFPKELGVGRILFLAVDEAYRSKGYARKLITYAINDLKSQGIHVIRLITRTDNISGQKLYTSMGFKQTWTDGAYIKFEKELDT